MSDEGTRHCDASKPDENRHQSASPSVTWMGRKVGRVLSQTQDSDGLNVVMEITDKLLCDALKDTARPGEFSVPETTVADVCRSIEQYRKAACATMSTTAVTSDPEAARVIEGRIPMRVVVNDLAPPGYIYILNSDV